jgi:hypothetical protein
MLLSSVVESNCRSVGGAYITVGVIGSVTCDTNEEAVTQSISHPKRAPRFTFSTSSILSRRLASASCPFSAIKRRFPEQNGKGHGVVRPRPILPWSARLLCIGYRSDVSPIDGIDGRPHKKCFKAKRRWLEERWFGSAEMQGRPYHNACAATIRLLRL